MKNNLKKGVNLIVLVVTIIVMLILAGVAIVSLQNSNSITKSKIAVLKTNVEEIINDTEIYIVRNRRKPRVKKYPVREGETVIPSALDPELANIIKIDQGKTEAEEINYDELFYLDKEDIKTSDIYEEEIILCVPKNGDIQLYFTEPKMVNEKNYYSFKKIKEEVK